MRFSEKLQHFMDGRNGNDNLNRFLSIVALVLLFISIFSGKNIFFWLGIALLISVYMRLFSKNIYARQAENDKYLEYRYKVTSFFTKKKARAADRTHVYVKCPNCKKQLRVPRGKGKIEISCPSCGNKFIKHT